MTSRQKCRLSLARDQKNRKLRAPDFTGKIKIHKRLIQTWADQLFEQGSPSELIASAAIWLNFNDDGTQFLTLEISPHFPSRKPIATPPKNKPEPVDPLANFWKPIGDDIERYREDHLHENAQRSFYR